MVALPARGVLSVGTVSIYHSDSTPCSTLYVRCHWGEFEMVRGFVVLLATFELVLMGLMAPVLLFSGPAGNIASGTSHSSAELAGAVHTLALGQGPAQGNSLTCASAGLLSEDCMAGSTSSQSPHASGIGWGRLCGLDSCPPAARGGVGLTYDPAGGYILLFGGIKALTTAPNTTFNDTWIFQNGAWTKLNVHGPSARLGQYMAYDYADGYVVLFGGGPYLTLNSTLYYSDTWKFENGTWTQLNLAVHPSPRGLGGVAYDPIDRYLLIYGGMGSETDIHSDTWTFYSGQWHNITSSLAQHPPPLLAPVMAYDPPSQEVVLFGGAEPVPGLQFGQDLSVTWVFSHGAWTNVTTSSGTPPDGRILASMGYDSAQGFLVLFGGWNTTTGALYGDTWLYSGGRWAIYFTSPTPSEHIIGAAAISTTPSAGVFFFGGIVGNYTAYWATNATWSFGPPPANSTVTATAATPFVVSFVTSPSPCHGFYFNGTHVFGGGNLTVLPDSYSVLAPTCPGYYFGSWYFSGGVEPAITSQSLTVVDVVGNGTLTLFYEQNAAVDPSMASSQIETQGLVLVVASVALLSAVIVLVHRRTIR